MKPTPARYHSAALILHWLIAVLLIFQFVLGVRIGFYARLSELFNQLQLHKSVGILILLLSLARLLLRYLLPRPAPADGGFKGLAARLTHGLFYLVMIGAPLTGWAMVSVAKIKVPTVLFGLVPWPHLPLPASMEGEQTFHAELAWLLPVLLVLHIGGVVWHWRLKDQVPARMLPAGIRPGRAIFAAVILLAGAGLAGAMLDAPNWWRGIGAKPIVARSDPIVPDTGLPDGSPADEAASSGAAKQVKTEIPEPPRSDWKVLPGSRLGFSTSYAGNDINGSFGSWRAAIRFDPENLPAARIEATIALGSARSGDAERDATLKGPGFFDVGMRPAARFTANGFERLGKDRYAARGMLSLNGISRPVRLVFTLRIAGDSAQAQGSATLSRLAFKVGQDEWESTDQIPDAVGVNFSIRAERK